MTTSTNSYLPNLVTDKHIQQFNVDNALLTNCLAETKYHTISDLMNELKEAANQHTIPYTVMGVNIQSLNANFIHLQTMLNSLAYKPNIIAVSETWIPDELSDLYSLDGYINISENKDKKKE